jgi:hypothetical protein
MSTSVHGKYCWQQVVQVPEVFWQSGALQLRDMLNQRSQKDGLLATARQGGQLD